MPPVTPAQAIRMVDFGSKRVSHVAGKPGILGKSDGAGTNASFSMPYSIVIHARQKYAFVADYNNFAIRKINLFTSQVCPAISCALF